MPSSFFLMEQCSTNPPPPNKKNITGERLRDEVESHEGITQHRLRQLPRMPRALFLLYAVLKVLLLLLQLLWVLLFKIQKPSLILVQVSFSSLLVKDEDVILLSTAQLIYVCFSCCTESTSHSSIVYGLACVQN